MQKIKDKKQKTKSKRQKTKNKTQKHTTNHELRNEKKNRFFYNLLNSNSGPDA